MATTQSQVASERLLELGDESVREHCRAVAEIAVRIAATLGFSEQMQERLRLAASLHDVGKALVPAEMLEKPGPLTPAEWREVARHPETGEKLLRAEGLGDLAPWVRSHHERLDGRGYPDGLEADRIPLESRILAVADAYDAMVTDRPYSAALSVEQAHEELRRGAGTQFDSRVVAAFLLAADRP